MSLLLPQASRRASAALAAFFVLATSGCATAQKPRPRTVGERIGSGIDRAITWTSEGIQRLLNREEDEP